MTIFKTGDLVYSYASKEFMLVLKSYGDATFYVYTMSGKSTIITDITIDHIDNLKKDYKDEFKIF